LEYLMERWVVQAALIVFAVFGVILMGMSFEPALACFPPWACSAPQPGPAPLIGAGLPIAGAVLAIVWAAHRFRR
jgi:hypothetical protein